MPSLPTPGSDIGTWGTKLNSFLNAAHNADGSIYTGGTAAIMVAASNAPARMKAQADYVCDGTADNVQIQAAYDAAVGDVFLTPGLFNVAATINVNRSGQGIYGSGNGVSQWAGSRSGTGTEIQWTGADNGGPVIDVGPTSGTSAIVAVTMKDFAVFASTQGTTPAANIGIRTRSMINGNYDNISVKEAKVACWQFSSQVSGFTGGNNNVHSCTFRKLSAFTHLFNGIPMQMISESTDNSGGTTCCSFSDTFLWASGASASLDLSACDDLYFFHTTLGEDPAGTSIALELRGKDVANGYRTSARNIHFYSLFPGEPATGTIRARAGDGTDPSHNNFIHGLSMEDGNVTVTIETGADLDYYMTRSGFRPEWNRLKIRPATDGANKFLIQNAAGFELLQFNTTQESLGIGIDPADASGGHLVGTNGRGIVIWRNNGKLPDITLRNQATSGDSTINLEGKTGAGAQIKGDWNMNGTTGASYFRTFTAHPLVFWTNNVERVRVPSGEGLDFNSGTFTNYQTRYKNNVWVKGRNAANNTDLNIFRVNTTDQIEFGGQAVTMPNGILTIGATPASTGQIRIENSGWLTARNAANSGDINMFRTNSLDYIQVGARLFRDDQGTSGNWTDLSAFLAMRRNFYNVTGGTNGVMHIYGVGKGTSSVANRGNGIYVRMDDASNVANKTITGMSRVGTTVTVTANSHGFANSDLVNIYGVTHTFDQQVNASWTISNVTTNTFDITVAGLTSGSYTSGGTVTNRPMMYAFAANVAPAVDRGPTVSALNSDDVNCFVAYNLGPGKATEAIYVGRNSSSFPSTPEWDTAFTADPYVSYGLFRGSGRVASGGSIFRGQDATVDSGGWGLTLPNNVSIAAKAAGGTLTGMMKLNTSDQLELMNAVLVTDAKDVAFGTSTGTKLGTSTSQKIGLWNAAPVAQYNTTGTATGFTANSGTAVNDASTFTGNTGSTAYRISDIVRALKLAGIMAA